MRIPVAARSLSACLLADALGCVRAEAEGESLQSLAIGIGTTSLVELQSVLLAHPLLFLQGV